MHDVNFDEIIDRRNTGTRKWDRMDELFGRNDLMPFWIADMDFKTSNDIISALKDECERGVFGYPDKLDECREALIPWMKARHNWDIPKGAISFFPRIMGGIAIAIESFTRPGDKIVIQSPVYPPFANMVDYAGRELKENPLINNDGKYEIDFGGLEKLFQDGAHVLMFCSPHNPVGRVWSKEELCRLAELCQKYNILIFCDEIHHDLIYSGHQHTCLGSMDGIRESLITFVAPTKTFNLPGLMASAAIIENKAMAEAYDKSLKRFDIQVNQMGQTAFIAAYQKAKNWLEQLLPYLEGNRDFVYEEIKKCKSISAFRPEGTYLYWLDFSPSGLNAEEIQKKLTDVAGVALHDGRMFGKCGEKFMRLNIACPREYLRKGINKIIGAFE
ncbi:MAG: MalY/PatB family protein [Synergistaceae bacterium]|nr:MalY/PatB family protein [Synergistaceae bacterium]